MGSTRGEGKQKSGKASLGKSGLGDRSPGLDSLAGPGERHGLRVTGASWRSGQDLAV